MTEQTDVMHTSGPWPIDFTGDGKRIVVGAGLVEGPNGYDVAEVYADDCPREVAEANGRLIAAAPDLLAALEEIDKINGGADWQGTRSIARAAIAKARGQ